MTVCHARHTHGFYCAYSRQTGELVQDLSKKSITRCHQSPLSVSLPFTNFLHIQIRTSCHNTLVNISNKDFELKQMFITTGSFSAALYGSELFY